MSLATERRRLVRARFYGLVGILVACVWGIQAYEFHQIYGKPGSIISSSSVSATSSVPNDWQKMAVQAITDTSALLTTLATALLGAVGLLVVKARDGSQLRHMWAAFLAAVSGGVSLYFGYASHLNLEWMLGIQMFDPYNPVLHFLGHAQFYSLLAGAFFFADFAFHDLGEED